jgi:hypothetical protein
MTSSRRTAVLLLAAACSLLPAGRAAAQGLDPGANKPYHLRVVLGIAEHRLLTPIFQEQVQRELGDSLQAALGDLATVEVVREHPHLKEAMHDGLQQSLDNWRDLEDVKTHFVLINYVNGDYEILARQHDGLTNQASAVVRRERIPDPDRQLVARTAALLVGQDFGPVGTVTGKGDNQAVQVALRGGALGVPLDRWLKKGDVMLLVQIGQGSGGPRATRVPWALLQVQEGPESGVCTCQLFNRHPNPLQQGPSTLGYRCLKLSTTRAPLRLRLVQASARTLTPVPNQEVHVRRQGFVGEDTTKVQGTTDADGFFSTEKDGDKGLYENIAFVSVMNGKVALVPKIPVALTDDRTIIVPVNISADANVQLTLRKDLWVGQVYESLLAVANLFKDLEKLLTDKKREDALSRAKVGLQGVKEDLARFEQQRQELETDIKAAPSARLTLDEGKERLKELQLGQEKLQSLIARLEKVVNEENDPKRKELQAKVSQAQVFEGEAEFGKALELYDQVLASGLDDADLKSHYEKLKQAWDVKSDKHKQAREFIYDTFPGIEPLKLAEHMDDARQAFETCRAAGDTLSPLKLLNVALEDAGKLKEKLNSLQPDVNDDDRTIARHIAEVADGLNKLVKDVKAYLDSAAPPEK